MDIPPGITVYNLPPSPPKWDRVGMFYITFCVIWTVFVIIGMIFCCINRHNQLLRLRGIGLSFFAIILLHLYWILGQIVYPIGRTIPTVLAYDIQYFFMGIWFPLGIALFHASNLRFLYVARLQKQYTETQSRRDFRCNGLHSFWLSRWICRLKQMHYMRRVLLFIGVGIVVQILLTVAMWLACRKYHPTYGIPGTEIRGATFPEQLIELGRGWEWWSSVLWQVIWTWIVAPVLIWRVWGIRDTMGWRTQTIGCCLSNLHATPMFLIASYVPAFAPINEYFAPSQWIHLSVLMFEIFTVFVPACQVLRQRLLVRRVVDLNAKWEVKSLKGSPFLAMRGRDGTGRPTSSELKSDDLLLNMSALCCTLERNPGPLQEFSAFKDFSGENIAFLTELAKWKASWHTKPDKQGRSLQRYNDALDIYTTFISPRDAEFPLNLASSDLKLVEDIFEKVARGLLGEVEMDLAVPFESTAFPGTKAHRAFYTGEVPVEFSPTVFDPIERHIKHLVLTNTWPKFVQATKLRKGSIESFDSDRTMLSGTTITSRLTNKTSRMFQTNV